MEVKVEVEVEVKAEVKVEANHWGSEGHPGIIGS